MLAHLFLQLQGAGLIEKQVVVSSDAEEQASGSGQGAVGQLPPGTWQLPLCMDTLPRGRLPHAQCACVGTRAAGTHGSTGLHYPCCPPWPGPTHLGRQLSGSAGPQTSHPAPAPAPLATELQPPHSEDEQVRGGSPAPHPAPLNGPGAPPQTPARSLWPGGSAGPKQCRSCHGLSWGETATSVPKSQLWPSLSCQGLGSWLLT